MYIAANRILESTYSSSSALSSFSSFFSGSFVSSALFSFVSAADSFSLLPSTCGFGALNFGSMAQAVINSEETLTSGNVYSMNFKKGFFATELSTDWSSCMIAMMRYMP